MRLVFAFLCITAVISPLIRGQENVHQQLAKILLLERQGQYASAIQAMQSISGFSTLSRADQGRAWTLFGFAYKETGQYQQAQTAFEKALSLLKDDAEQRADFANALDFFAAFYQSVNKPQIAGKLWSQALEIFKQQGNHRCLAKTYANLAATALEQKKVHAAKAFFSKATAEMTPDLTDDDRAFISDIQGWIDDKTGHASDAVDDYERALAFWRKNHGEEHPFTGWRYLLLGNAYAANGEPSKAIAMMAQGLAIMDRTAGRQNPKYVAGEMMYARVLDRYGKQTEAAQLRAEATQHLSELYHNQCLDCTVSVWSLR
jgi:tetratricopeptide (TPR) repeat protein